MRKDRVLLVIWIAFSEAIVGLSVVHHTESTTIILQHPLRNHAEPRITNVCDIATKEWF